MRSLGHGVLYKVPVGDRNSGTIRSRIGGIWRLSENRDEKSGGMWLVV